ncbi:DUF6777 domain-containing protein [Rhodococcoides yunnanense]|uniref:DUF6777 domain-containing protein n=1 Tax=Rhodococcoides yunnanense TaxID=278209 RepID=UPI001114A2C8|nr:DUF6777 domain-containing protein [Rhodococcus yunnanensis]
MTTGSESSTWQDPNPQAGTRDNSRTVLGATAAALSVTVLSALAVTLLVTGGSAASTAEVALQSADSIGPGPFTPSVALSSRALSDLSSDDVLAQLAGSISTSSSGMSSIAGTTPGLYGGTDNESSCDAAALANYLGQNRAASEAWASTFGISTQAIPFFLDTLTPVVLTTDMRVTNYSFDGEAAIPFQSVLQAGTAVLVDAAGVPRIRCNCGNPLGPPASEPLSAYQATGERWPSYTEQDVVAVEYATQPETGEPVPDTPNNAKVDEFTLVDLESLKPLLRSVGKTIDTSALERPSTPLPDPRGMNLPSVPVTQSADDTPAKAAAPVEQQESVATPDTKSQNASRAATTSTPTAPPHAAVSAPPLPTLPAPAAAQLEPGDAPTLSPTPDRPVVPLVPSPAAVTPQISPPPTGLPVAETAVGDAAPAVVNLETVITTNGAGVTVGPDHFRVSERFERDGVHYADTNYRWTITRPKGSDLGYCRGHVTVLDSAGVVLVQHDDTDFNACHGGGNFASSLELNKAGTYTVVVDIEMERGPTLHATRTFVLDH